MPAPILAPFDCPLFDPPEAGRTPAQRGEGGCPSSRCQLVSHAKRNESKATPWRRARTFFRLRKKPNPPFDALRAVWPHFGFLSCGFVRRRDAALAEKTIRSLTRLVFDQLEPAARLSRWPRIGRNPGALRLWLVALPRDLSPLPQALEGGLPLVAQGAHRRRNLPRRQAPAKPGHFRREHARDRLGLRCESGSGARVAGGAVSR